MSRKKPPIPEKEQKRRTKTGKPEPGTRGRNKRSAESNKRFYELPRR